MSRIASRGLAVLSRPAPPRQRLAKAHPRTDRGASNRRGPTGNDGNHYRRQEWPEERVSAVGDSSRGRCGIIGTHFGQPGTPGWYYNLRADPVAEIVFRDTRVNVVAREAHGDEWRVIWDRAHGYYAGYDAYARRIDDRPIHIMVLTEIVDS